MKHNIKSIINQFAKFALVGLLNTILNLIITYSLIFCFKNVINDKIILTFIANSIGFILTTFNSYCLNNKFVFTKTKKGNIWPLIKTYICYGFTFFLGFGLTKIFVDIFEMNAFLIPILSLTITVPLNFLINKFWSFA